MNRSSVTELLEHARRRMLVQLVLDNGSLALLVGMAGMILLLLAGTEVLNWYWPVLLIVASVGFGAYRVRKSIPSLYRLAQHIDKRLGLSDSLSTAFYFGSNPAPGREAVCERQQRLANATAAEVDIKHAVPFSRSRYLMPAAGLALVALGLFALRFAVTGTMSLQPSLLKIAYDQFFNAPQEQAKALKAKLDPNHPFDPGQPDAQSNFNDPPPEDLLNADSPDDASNPSPDKSKEAADGKSQDKSDLDPGDKQDDSGKGDQGNSKEGKQDDKKGKDKEGNSDKGGEPNQGGMMDKLKDALQNLLSKMTPNNGPQSAQNNKQQAKSDAGDKGKSQEKGNKGDSQADSNQNGDKTQSDDQAKASSQSQPTSQEASSAAGSKDGEKAIQDAKAQQAMGKIAELLGQRSASVTGEVMVEVGSTKQSLVTPWTQNSATHREAGGEIHRDEIPLIDQQFVEKYFEEIHKSAPPKTRTPATAKDSK